MQLMEKKYGINTNIRLSTSVDANEIEELYNNLKKNQKYPRVGFKNTVLRYYIRFLSCICI